MVGTEQMFQELSGKSGPFIRVGDSPRSLLSHWALLGRRDAGGRRDKPGVVQTKKASLGQEDRRDEAPRVVLEGVWEAQHVLSEKGHGGRERGTWRQASLPADGDHSWPTRSALRPYALQPPLPPARRGWNGRCWRRTATSNGLLSWLWPAYRVDKLPPRKFTPKYKLKPQS